MKRSLIINYVSLGMIIGITISMIVLSFYPIPETEQACGKCGSSAWYFKLAEGDE